MTNGPRDSDEDIEMDAGELEIDFDQDDVDYDEIDSTDSNREMPRFLKIGSGLILLAFVGSLLVPLMGIFSGDKQNSNGTEGLPNEAGLEYQLWIQDSLTEELTKYPGGASFYGLNFRDSIRNPVIGITLDSITNRNVVDWTHIQGHSISIFQAIFDDERADSAMLVWLATEDNSLSLEQNTEVIVLAIGMLETTADGIDWSGIGPADIRYVADYYEELPIVTEETSEL